MSGSLLTFPVLPSAMMVADQNPNSSTADDISDQTTRIHQTDKESNGCQSVTKNNFTTVATADDSLTKPPGLSYIALISMAIQSSADKKMMLSEIYQWIAERYPYYQLKDKSWRNSIRHNLSLNECFVKCGRSENGKGNYWAIHPANIDDFAKGDFRRRRARRRVRKCDEDLQRLCSDTLEMEMRDIPSSVAQDGYVPMVSTLVPCNFLSIIGIEPVKPCEYWMKDTHNKPVIPYRNPGHINPFQNNAYTGSDDVTSFCNQSVMPYIPYFGCVNDSDMRTTVEPGDSALNLNLDMPENRAVTSSRPDYVTPCFERERSWKDIHL